MQDLLVVAIGKYVVSIDLSRARAGAAPGGFSIDQPALCTMENPLEGVTVVGIHHDTVSDLAITPYSSTRILSASQDGTVCFKFM
jgi:enhancer of mRNA-decapping protein 4